MPIISGGGGGGNTTAQVVMSGKVLPAANPTGVTVDTTTYADPIAGGGAKLTTLVFPANAGALAIALAGDAFPRWLLAANALDGLYIGPGTSDAYSVGVAIAYNAAGLLLEGSGGNLNVGLADTNRGGVSSSTYPFAPRNSVNGSGGAISSGTGVPTAGGEVGDHYFRADGPPYFYECTVAGGTGAATWVTLPQAAPADAKFRAGDAAVWFDKTNGAAKLNVKGKTTDGTVVTASIAMA